MSDLNKTADAALNRDTLLRGLQILSDHLGKQGVTGELCLFSGAVMVLAFNARLATKDVDALFQPAQIIRDLANRIADDLHLSSGWLNDGVKDFLSARHETTTENLPAVSSSTVDHARARVFAGHEVYGRASGRNPDEPSDVADIIFLIRQLKLKSAPEVSELVGLYYPANRDYPANRVPVKTRYLVEGLFEEGKL